MTVNGARGHGDGRVPPIPVHGITLPDDRAVMRRCLHGLDVPWEVCRDLVVAVAGDEDDLADLVGRVEDVEERDEVGRRHARADFDADRVRDAAEELDVRVGGLAGAVADPKEVGGCAVVALGGSGGCGPV